MKMLMKRIWTSLCKVIRFYVQTTSVTGCTCLSYGKKCWYATYIPHKVPLILLSICLYIISGAIADIENEEYREGMKSEYTSDKQSQRSFNTKYDHIILCIILFRHGKGRSVWRISHSRRNLGTIIQVPTSVLEMALGAPSTGKELTEHVQL